VKRYTTKVRVSKAGKYGGSFLRLYVGVQAFLGKTFDFYFTGKLAGSKTCYMRIIHRINRESWAISRLARFGNFRLAAANPKS
jgi:hypothetical protein